MNTPRRKILIADDNLVVLKVLSMKMAAHGFDVIAVSETDQIIGRVSEEVPHLIVLDQHFGYQAAIDVPEWNGLRILRWMNRLEHLRDIPIVMITADESVELKADALKFGASAFLHKPLDYEQFIRLCISLSESEPGAEAGKLPAGKDEGVIEPAITTTAKPEPALELAAAPAANPNDRNWIL